MLPMHLKINDHMIEYSTAEIYSWDQTSIRFRLTQPQDEILFDGVVLVENTKDYRVVYQDDKTYIYSNLDGRIEEYLTVRLL